VAGAPIEALLAQPHEDEHRAASERKDHYDREIFEHDSGPGSYWERKSRPRGKRTLKSGPSSWRKRAREQLHND
jgi:hypothetical protein